MSRPTDSIIVECPVNDCDWTWTIAPSPLDDAALARIYGSDLAYAQSMQRAWRRHFDGHSLLELVRPGFSPAALSRLPDGVRSVLTTQYRKQGLRNGWPPLQMTPDDPTPGAVPPGSPCLPQATVPSAAFDAAHPDHDNWAFITRRCLANPPCDRHTPKEPR